LESLTETLGFGTKRVKGYQMPTGTIVITEDEERTPSEKVVIYARVSSSEHKSNLETQADRLAAYCAAKGWQVQRVIKEVGSGVNDSRDKLLKLLADTSITVIVVEHKDRLTRFGFNYISTLLESQGRRIEVVNLAGNSKEGLLGSSPRLFIRFVRVSMGNVEPSERPNRLLHSWRKMAMQLVEQHIIKP